MFKPTLLPKKGETRLPDLRQPITGHPSSRRIEPGQPCMPGLFHERKPGLNLNLEPPRPRCFVIDRGPCKILWHMPNSICRTLKNASVPQCFQPPEMSLPPGWRCCWIGIDV